LKLTKPYPQAPIHLSTKAKGGKENPFPPLGKKGEWCSEVFSKKTV